MPRFGESGPGVVALQKAIIGNGFTLRGGATGNFDKTTLRALKTFQKVVGLKVTGVVDQPTAKVLKLVSPAPTTTVAAPPTTAAAQFPFTMSSLPVRGTRGETVLTVQKALAAAGVAVRGGIDGIFGSGTASTIADFQTSRAIASSGLLDEATAIALGLVAPVAVTPAAAPVPAPTPLDTDALPVRGNRGDAVRILQTALVAAGITVKGGADGVFGVATAVSLRKYQTANGLAVTGLADIPTVLKLGLIAPPPVSIAAFPVQGKCSFVDTWHAPRGDRMHLGVDIIAPEGQLVYAAAAGIITKTYSVGTDRLAGNGVRLTAPDGTYFFYGHFQRIADGIGVGSRVTAGQVIGYVGRTGATNTPHVHFEVHPRGGEAINPFPVVKAVDSCHVTEPRPAIAA